MKRTAWVWILLLMVACGGGSGPNPEVMAAFNDYRHNMGLQLTDEQARCFAGVQQDVFGREDAIRMFREPQQWNYEALSSGDWEQVQAKLETAGQRIMSECELE